MMTSEKRLRIVLAALLFEVVACGGSVRGEGEGGASGDPGEPAPDGGSGSDSEDLVKAGTPDGACLLEYNDALVSGSADACCATVNGENTCNLAILCNDKSGPDCCLIYATAVAAGGNACCLYAGGEKATNSHCGALLSYRR